MNILSGKEEVQKFVFGNLFGHVSRVDCPPTLNVQRAFRDHLASQLRAKLMADELAEKWRLNLLQLIERQLVENWDGLGVPRPMALLNDEETLVTWTHPKFSELSGLDPLRNEFFAIMDWLNGLSSQEFLIPCVCLLALIGADPIFVTEGSGDGGVDCIGKIERGPLRSLCLFVQAKTSSSRITRDRLLMEYGKYQMLPHLDRYKLYRENLGLNSSSDGASLMYMLVSNNEFDAPARSVASNLGVLLRSRTQLAYWLWACTSREVLEKLIENLRQFARPGGSFTNLAPRIKSHLGIQGSNWRLPIA